MSEKRDPLDCLIVDDKETIDLNILASLVKVLETTPVVLQEFNKVREKILKANIRALVL